MKVPRVWALALMMASGFAGLGYQIVWTQQSSLWLGHEAAAVLAVVAAFFGGIAFGALLLGDRIERSSRPARWYAACEASIGAWGLALVFLVAPVSEWMLGWIGLDVSPLRQWTIVFLGTFVLLLPATVAMGATLPAMERILAPLRAERAAIALLYAGNTAGAVLGVIATAFVLVPWIGLSATAMICVAVNFVCAGLALRVFGSEATSASAVTGPAVPSLPPARAANGHWRMLAATGLLGIGYEVLVVRVLSQVAENTVFTFAILLAVYLIGTALGAFGYTRLRGAVREKVVLRDRLLQALTFACLSGVAALSFAVSIKGMLLRVFGSGMSAALCAEATLAVLAFVLPTIVMGALFSHLATVARESGVSFGRAIGVNTLGAALAPLVCGVFLLPWIGSTYSLCLVAGGYLLLAAPRAWLSAPQYVAAAGVVALAVWAPSLALVRLPEGGRLVSVAEGSAATVSVVEDEERVATLHIDNRQQEGSSATLLADGRQGLLPVLLHPDPHRALFLGLGTGLTSGSAALDVDLQVDAVELLPGVIDASARFAQALGSAANSRLEVINADARRFVRVSHEHYDVIVADNFHPARAGSGALYTVEHFAAVRERLASGGVFCQWLPLHQLDLGTLRSIVRAYLKIYPHGWAMLATNSLETPVLGLVSRRDGEKIDVAQVRRRLASVRMTRDIADFGINDDLALLGSFAAGPKALAAFAANAPLNTDDHPVVTYLAPQITYAPDSAPRDRLLGWLAQVSIEPAELLTPEAAPRESQRLAAYWQARNRYLALGRNVRPTYDAREMLAQVQEPLLSVLRISPDFRPAYDPLLRMAEGIAASDAGVARELLSQLESVQPARTEAAEALRALALR